MRILNWMQQKLSARQPNKKSTAADACIANHKASKEDESKANSSKHIGLEGWQQGLLTIGTFGNCEIDEKVGEKCESHENSSAAVQDLTEFTLEEVGKLKQELTKYLALKHSRRAADQDPQSKGGGHRNDCPLNKFLNCPSSLDVDRTGSLRHARDSISENEDPDNYYVVASKARDVCSVDGTSTGIRQRSVSFLLKKMFTCRGGFGPSPNLREPQLLESRMEKLIKVILHHKIYPQNATSGKRLIQRKSTEKMDQEDESKARESDRCKWVKTDSEFIVLEM